MILYIPWDYNNSEDYWVLNCCSLLTYFGQVTHFLSWHFKQAFGLLILIIRAKHQCSFLEGRLILKLYKLLQPSL